MNTALIAIKYRVLFVIVAMVSALGGLSAYQNLARFEDPEFTIRIALVYTSYPGATASQVAEEVSAPLEQVIQELPEVKEVISTSTNGLSEIKVEIDYSYSKTPQELQTVWTKLRNKISDAQSRLPPGALKPLVNDDFGDTYGLYYLLTGKGYSAAELFEYAKDLRQELLIIDGVGKIVVNGDQKEEISIEFSRQKLASLGTNVNAIFSSLESQNKIVPAGSLRLLDNRVVIASSEDLLSVDALKNLQIKLQPDGQIIFLKDVASVIRNYRSPTNFIMRYNGELALGFGVSAAAGTNVVKIGAAISDGLERSKANRPLGIEVHEFYHQGKAVDVAIQDFVVNVFIAVAIVFVTLVLFMGIKSGAIIGFILFLTILATLFVMSLTDIAMHRISLGALIVALGMLVDNAIVVVDGIIVGLGAKQRKIDVIKNVVGATAYPLFGGTLIGIIAFAPTGFAPGAAAEFTGDLFWVILISMTLSWLFAITLTPLFCFWLFPDSEETTAKKKTNPVEAVFKNVFTKVLSYRLIGLAIAASLFAISIYSFSFIKNGFFPDSTINQLVVDYELPAGTDIERTNADLGKISEFVKGLDGVEDVHELVGGGTLRFMLVYQFASPSASYGQILVKVDDYKKLDVLIPQVQNYINNAFPDSQAKVWRFIFGPGAGSKIEASFQGPDPDVLRKLAGQAQVIMSNHPNAVGVKNDWRGYVPTIVPIFSETRARRAGISKVDFNSALQLHFGGLQVGTFREGDLLVPIVAKVGRSVVLQKDLLENVIVTSSSTGRTVSILQVVDGFRTEWLPDRLIKENSQWTIKAQADPKQGILPSLLFNELRPQIEKIPLPFGYTLDWDGEYGDSKLANDNMAEIIPIGLIAMVLTVFALFNAVRQPIIIWLTVPLAIIGVVFGLVLTGIPLEFMGIIGLLSLSGLLIKNAIVLLDEIDKQISAGVPRFLAITNSTFSRLRPVSMGALTTILGIMPLLGDPFFQSMAVVMIFGLFFATILTLFVVPMLYMVFFRISESEI